MYTQSLNGEWKFRQVGTQDWLPATVPGCNFTDLMRCGSIPDPFIGENEKLVQWVAEKDWEYQCSFSVNPALLEQECIELVCGGLDTLAEVHLNGVLLGRTDNMFRQYRWRVEYLLKPSENTLTILFRSPMAYLRDRQNAHPLPSLMNEGMAHLRKVHSHFGWDWGPRLPISGIWRDIWLEGSTTARFADILIHQDHAPELVKLTVSARCSVWQAANLYLSITLTTPDGFKTQLSTPILSDQASLSLDIPDPHLWWVNGLGAQPLYQLEAALLSGVQLLDQRSFKIGLRSLKLIRQPDAWGESFTFVINDIPFFAKGANWIPADSFPTRLTQEKLEHLIKSAASANMNMLRVWGGGYYEEDRFYDLCDRYGILVWQDFMFARAAYPLDNPTFRENAESEIAENIRRLRHHACLALWCGNNEVEMLWGLWKRHRQLTQACEEFFYHRLPELVAEHDPDRPYWFSSPSSGRFMQQTNADEAGDSHLWQVWHGLKPFTYYRSRLTRFCSEFGLEALPSLETIAAFAKPEEHTLYSRVMRHHQRSAGGNDRLIYYLTGRFRLPRRFVDLIYLTQIVQAEAVRIGVEHWYRNFPRCAGALYWQLNDCWYVISWSSIDFEGRWKALQYMARRFFAPLALSIEEDGNERRVYAINETLSPWQGSLRWSLEKLDGEVIKAGDLSIALPAQLVSRLCELDFSAQLRQHSPRELVFIAELQQDQQTLARRLSTFLPEKDLSLPDPRLSVEVAQREDTLLIEVTAQALARFVTLSLTGADMIFSDNFFDLPAGRSVHLTCPLPAGWDLDQARRALQVRSLADVTPARSKLADRLDRCRMALKPVNLFSRLLFNLIK